MIPRKIYLACCIKDVLKITHTLFDTESGVRFGNQEHVHIFVNQSCVLAFRSLKYLAFG